MSEEEFEVRGCLNFEFWNAPVALGLPVIRLIARLWQVSLKAYTTPAI